MQEKAPLAPSTAASGAVASRETERAEAPPAQKRAKMQMDSSAPSRKLETAFPRPAETVTLTLGVNDIAAAVRTVESVLRDLGAERIERSPSGEAEIVMADLPAQSIKDLLERLSPFVEAKEWDSASQPAERIVLLRIEIRRR